MSWRRTRSDAQPTMRLAHWVRIVASIIVVAAIAHFGYAAYLVNHYANLDERRKVDAIVVLGAAQYNGKPSAVLESRLNHAAKLWKADVAPTIVVTGGKMEGDRFTEASASAAYLATKGVPDHVILREVQGRTSWESLKASAAFLNERDIHSVLLVSDPFHNARIRDMARKLGLEAYVSATPESRIGGTTLVRYSIKEVMAIGIGRVVGYDRIAQFEKSFAS